MKTTRERSLKAFFAPAFFHLLACSSTTFRRINMTQVLTSCYLNRCDVELSRLTLPLASILRKRPRTTEHDSKPTASKSPSLTSPVKAALSTGNGSQSSDRSPINNLGFLKNLNPDTKKQTKGSHAGRIPIHDVLSAANTGNQMGNRRREGGRSLTANPR